MQNINKWLNNSIQLRFIMKNFNMSQWRVLCPHNHVIKTTSTAGAIRELSSYPRNCLMDQSMDSYYILALYRTRLHDQSDVLELSALFYACKSTDAAHRPSSAPPTPALHTLVNITSRPRDQ